MQKKWKWEGVISSYDTVEKIYRWKFRWEIFEFVLQQCDLVNA